MVTALAFSLLLLAPIEADDLEDIPQPLQTAALTATVRLVNPAQQAEGSGTIVGQRGVFVYILTANHVVEGARELEVSTFSARSYPRPAAVYRTAEVIARAAHADLALVRLATADSLPGRLPICLSGSAPDGKEFPGLSAGCGLDGVPFCRKEVVRARKRVRKPGQAESAIYWEVDRPPEKGRSGGPLCDRDGRLIGVASGTDGQRGYYSHLEEIHAFLKEKEMTWLYEKQPGKGG